MMGLPAFGLVAIIEPKFANALAHATTLA